MSAHHVRLTFHKQCKGFFLISFLFFKPLVKKDFKSKFKCDAPAQGRLVMDEVLSMEADDIRNKTDAHRGSER